MASLQFLLITLVLVTIAATHRDKYDNRLSFLLKKKGLSRYGRKNTASPSAPPSLPNIECGMLPDDRLSKRIKGGETAAPHGWPSICHLSVMMPSPHRGKHEKGLCGSTLIKNQKGTFYAITAIHCLKNSNDPSDYSVRCGIHDLTGDPVSHEQVLQVKSITKHSDYVYKNNPQIRAHDMALLELSTQPSENDFVQAACLPTKPPAVNDSAVVVGWGYTELERTVSGKRPYKITKPDKLQELVMPIIANKECENMMNADGDTYFNCEEQGFVCAGYAKAGKGACNGDSGGPLYLRSEGRWTLIGVADTVVGLCAEEGYVDAFADVFGHLDWINYNINN